MASLALYSPLSYQQVIFLKLDPHRMRVNAALCRVNSCLHVYPRKRYFIVVQICPVLLREQASRQKLCESILEIF